MAKKAILDLETGLIEQEFDFNEGDTFKHVQSEKKESGIKYYNHMKEVTNQECKLNEYNKQLDGFSFCYYEKLLDKNLSDLAITAAILLSTHMEYGTNRLVVKVNTKWIVTMNKVRLTCAMLVNDRLGKEILQELLDNEVLIFKDKSYYLSTELFSKGKLNRELKAIRIYHKSIRDLYEVTNPKSRKFLHYLFMLLPYLHTNTNILISREHQHNELELITLKADELVEALGITITNHHTKSRLLDSLYRLSFTFNDKKYMAFNKLTKQVYDGDYLVPDEFFVINPLLFWGGNDLKEIKNTIMLFAFSDISVQK